MKSSNIAASGSAGTTSNVPLISVGGSPLSLSPNSNARGTSGTGTGTGGGETGALSNQAEQAHEKASSLMTSLKQSTL